MKKSSMILIIATILVSCTKPIILNETSFEKKGIYQYGQIPERNFYIRKNLSDSLHLVNEFTTKGSYSNTSPVIFDKFLFVPDLSGRITAFNIESGKEIGRESYKGESPIAPVIYRSRIFFVVNEYKERYATIHYYDFYTQQYIKKNEISGSIINEMLFDEEDIYIISSLGTLIKLNLIGEIEWEIETGKEVNCDPAMKGDKIILATTEGELIIFNKKSKEIENTYSLDNGVHSGIIVKNNHLFLGDDKGIFYSFDLEGNLNWKTNLNYKIVTSSAADDSSLFIGNLNGDFYRINIQNGNVIYRKHFDALFNATPLVFNNVVIQPNYKHDIFIIDKKEGELKNTVSTESRAKMTPVYFEGKLYFGIDKGKILVYEE